MSTESLKRIDSRVSAVKDITILALAVSMSYVSLLPSEGLYFIYTIAIMATALLSTVFLLFKIAKQSEVEDGVYARARAFEATVIIIGAWLIVTGVLVLLRPLIAFASWNDFTTLGVCGFISGAGTGFLILLFKKFKLDGWFLSIAGYSDDDSYPGRLPFPSAYMISFLVATAVSRVILSSLSLLGEENRAWVLAGGFATLLSLIFLLCIQTYLEPTQYTSGLGDLLFGLICMGTILSMTITFWGSILSIVASVLLVYIRRDAPPDTESIRKRAKLRNLEEEKILTMFYETHQRFMTFTLGIKIALFMGVIYGLIHFTITGELFWLILYFIEFLFVEVLRYGKRQWFIRKHRRALKGPHIV